MPNGGLEEGAEPQIVRFGVFELDLRTGELRKSGIRIRLQDQPFKILAMLIEQPGELVTREEIQNRLWPEDMVVDFEYGINSALTRLRAALSDSARDPRYIETLAKRGYRFVGTVVKVSVQEPTPAEPTVIPERFNPEFAERQEAAATRSSGLHLRLMIFGLALLVLGVCAGALVVWLFRPGQTTFHPIRSVAVLPFENLSGDPSQEYLADGMTDAIITELARLGGMTVISRTSAMAYKGARKHLREIGRELHVDAVIEGSMLRSGNRLRITAQLIELPADRHLWAQSYEREYRDILALQDEIAADIARQVQGELRQRGPSANRKPGPGNNESLQRPPERPFFLGQAYRGRVPHGDRIFQSGH